MHKTKVAWTLHHLLLQEVAFSLALGEISEPFESPEGFHMLMRIA